MSAVTAAIKAMEAQAGSFTVPSVTQFSRKDDPFIVLVSCILSLRTKDKTTIEASNRLFRIAASAEKMSKLALGRMQKAIYPVGFYRNKASVIRQISRRITEELGNKVPDTIEGLLELKGVGRKTANLVLGLGYGIPAICVDTHVHRISNRLGWVKTSNPFETEMALQRLVPRRLWIKLNTIMVSFGQNICLPVSPFCTKCSIKKICRRAGVKRCR